MARLSRRQYTDAIFIFDRHDVAAARVLDDSLGGGCVWSRERADLAEIVTELLDLPEPGQSGARTGQALEPVATEVNVRASVATRCSSPSRQS